MDRSTLNKATSADDTPLPGYLLVEIAKSTFSDLTASQQLADYLLKKLERDNPYVKQKVLRIIKHVCEQGKPDFRRAIQQKSQLIKSCLTYRGEPDTLKGDAPNKAVREEADAAVKAMFSSDSSSNAYGIHSEGGRKMQGFGSDTPEELQGRGGNSFGGGGGSYGGGGGGYGGGGNSAYERKSFSSGGMVGFGNPNFDNSPKEESGDVFKQAANSAMAAVTRFAAKVNVQVPGYLSQTDKGPELPSSTYRAPPAPGSGGFESRPAFEPPRQPSGFGSQQGQQPWGNQSRRPAPPPSHKEPGDYEARVVAELCTPGGARVAPSSQALEEFCRKCESLDSQAVGEQLRQKLSAADWQTRLKALYAIESLQGAGLDGIVGHVSQYASEALFECQEMPQCRQKASKVLHVLGFIDEPAEEKGHKAVSSSTAAPTAAPAAALVDLLDMDESPPAPQQSTAPATTASSLLEGPGLLEGFDTSPVAPAVSTGSLVDIGAPLPGGVAPSGGLLEANLVGGISGLPSGAGQTQLPWQMGVPGPGVNGGVVMMQPPLMQQGGMMGGAPAVAQQVNRTAHLSILSGGGMGQMQMPYNPMGPPMGGPMGGQMGGPMGGPMGGMMGGPLNGVGGMGGMGAPMGGMGGMMGQGAPAPFPGAMGQGSAPQGAGMGSSFGFLSGSGNGPAPPGGGSAFGFIGGQSPPAQSGPVGSGSLGGGFMGGGLGQELHTGPSANSGGDSAFSFVADELKGLRH